ncbi:TolB-like 6-bladed beta-propeller domain-containing protein [Bacteroides cellulosilyticus]|jgi:hypothetical protein|uniref:hypothetical protein n=1 Tax=Bacteroides cellulosilyticus TaxID=246787 RepID=UPI0018983809|nr:hypothetical protein [Bacteroides cellulosilyticus]
MERIKYIFCFIFLSIVCISCHEGCDDSTYFNGKIRIIEDNSKAVKKVSLKNVILNGANFGYIAVYDSLMFFLNSKLPDRSYNIFNINTGEEIGTFCNKGGGPEEAAAFGPIFQFFKKGNDLKTLLFAPHEGKLFIWNITQSITQGSTIIDKVIPYTWRNENGGACYNEMYLQNNNILLARVDPFPINDADATLLFYQKRTLDTNKALKNYAIYKQTIKNREAPIIPEDFFASADAFKPDGTKIVQVMGHLPQLNILDFETGQVVGYRMEGGDDFSVFQGKKNIKNYYVEVQADDNYIYALYWGRDRWGMYEIPCVNTIHVFDWYGRLVQKLETDYDIDKMFLDTVRNRLYVTRPKSDDVYYLDLDEIFD